MNFGSADLRAARTQRRERAGDRGDGRLPRALADYRRSPGRAQLVRVPATGATPPVRWTGRGALMQTSGHASLREEGQAPLDRQREEKE
jgi:hypothetical protein